MARSRTGPQRPRDMDPEVRPAQNPEEVGGAAALSLFDATNDSRVRVLRLDDKDKRFVHHGILAAEDANETTIGVLFGGGTYRAQLLVRDETGREIIKRQRDFKLPGEYKPPIELPTGKRLARPGDPVTSATAPPVGMSALPPTMDQILSAGMLQLFQASAGVNQELRQTMAVQREAMARPGTDWVALLTAITPLVVAFLGQKKEDQNPLDLIRTVTEMVRGMQAPKSDVRELIDGMREIMDFREAATPGAGSGDPLLDAVPKLIDVIREGQKQQTVSPVPGTTMSTGSQATVTAAAALPPWHRILLAQGPRLVGLAERGVDPGFAAEMALTMMPEQARGVVMEFVRDLEHVNKTLVVVPALQSYQQWVMAFFAEVAAALLGDDADEDPETPPGEIGETP